MNDEDFGDVFKAQRTLDEQRAPSFVSVIRNVERSNRTKGKAVGRTFAPWAGWLLAGGVACLVVLSFELNPIQPTASSTTQPLSKVLPLFSLGEEVSLSIFAELEPLGSGTPSDFLLPDSSSNLFL